MFQLTNINLIKGYIDCLNNKIFYTVIYKNIYKLFDRIALIRALTLRKRYAK